MASPRKPSNASRPKNTKPAPNPPVIPYSPWFHIFAGSFSLLGPAAEVPAFWCVLVLMAVAPFTAKNQPR